MNFNYFVRCDPHEITLLIQRVERRRPRPRYFSIHVVWLHLVLLDLLYQVDHERYCFTHQDSDYQERPPEIIGSSEH
jgi:hypothetical protein